MSETAETTRIGAREGAAARAWVEAHWFPLGVAAITIASAGFLFHQLLAWPPHEDEALPLFVGRHPLDELFQVVLEERGGAPLHFLIAWAVAQLDLGLAGLRAVSAAFAVASLPVVALLAARLGGRVRALVATLVVAASWTFLFHGVYGRMYSLFLLTSTLSYLALLRALERGGRTAWSLWALAILATVATHPYGALVLASQGAFVVVARRDRLRAALWAFGAVAVLGIPFWLTDLVLAGRFDAGVGGGDGRLDVLEFVWHAAGDFTAGFPVLPAVLVAAAAGLAVLPRETRVLTASAALVPLAALVVARSTGSPETRHLIFLLPFVALAVGAGLVRLGPRVGRRPRSRPSSSRRSRGRGTGRPSSSNGSLTSGRKRAPTPPPISRRRPARTTSSSATTRSSSRPGSGIPTSRSSCCRGPTRTSPSATCSTSSARSGTASGSSTRARRRTT